MEKLTGHEEKQKIVCAKIDFELSVLPNIFTQYVSYLRERKKTNTTILSYLTTLTACLRTVYRDFYISNEFFYEEIKEKDIVYYFDAKGTLNVKTLQSHWTTLNSFFTFLVENKYITKSPMESIRRPIERDTKRQINYLNRSQLDRLLMTIRHSPTRFTAFRDEVIIKLAIATGMEVSDMVNLNFDDIDFIKRTIRVTNKKGIRYIPIGTSNILLLKKWGKFRQEYFKNSDTAALFVSTRKTRISVDAVGNMLRNYCEDANVPLITYKDLKSTMVYLLAKENVSMEAIIEFLGISDYLVVVQAYDAAMKEQDININDVINGLFEETVEINRNEENELPDKRDFSLELKLPEYAEYMRGGNGFTLYGNVTNLTEQPIKLKLKYFSVYIDGMLRTSDYWYSGYQFEEELIFPKTVHTFGKIWLTDDLSTKKLQDTDYAMLCFVDTNLEREYYIKFVYKENNVGDYWLEQNWYEADC